MDVTSLLLPYEPTDVLVRSWAGTQGGPSRFQHRAWSFLPLGGIFDNATWAIQHGGRSWCAGPHRPKNRLTPYPARSSNPKRKTAIIGFDQALLRDRTDVSTPTGAQKLAAELEAGDFSTVEKDALGAGRGGAMVLDIKCAVVYNSNPQPDEPNRPLHAGKSSKWCKGAGRCTFVHPDSSCPQHLRRVEGL